MRGAFYQVRRAFAPTTHTEKMNLISAPADISSKDAPLREDIRLLGRILGDTLREQEGEQTYALIENVRRAAVRFRKTQDDRDRDQLEQMLDALSPEETLLVVRAFSYFSQLSNIAEDLHHNRRRRAHLKAGSPPQEGSMQLVLDHVQEKNLDAAAVQAFFDKALISPVLTAHPTEVQRKSILNCQLVISSLLSDRDRLDMTPEELADNEETLHRFVLILWSTRMLRTSKLSVQDEVKNGLSFYDYTFLREIPKLYSGLEKQIETRFGKRIELPPFLRVGSWIGGDRDGNPFVTHDVMLDAAQRHSAAVLDYYLSETNLLSSRLSLSNRLVDVSPELAAFAEQSPDKAVSREDEPYRRALLAIYARLVATTEHLGHHVQHLHPVSKDVMPYSSAAELIAELDVVIHSLEHHGALYLSRGRMAELRRAVGSVRLPPGTAGHAPAQRHPPADGERIAGECGYCRLCAIGRRRTSQSFALRVAGRHAAGHRTGQFLRHRAKRAAPDARRRRDPSPLRT